MKLNKEECNEALTRLLRPYFAKVDVQNVYHNINKGYSIEEDSNLLTLLIMKHFDNPPLRSEELKEGMWVWDNQQKEYIKINRLKMAIISMNNYRYYIYPTCWSIPIEFEENRFYRKQVEEWINIERLTTL